MGTCVKKDESAALYWYEQAARVGDVWSKNKLVEMYRDGIGVSVDLDKAYYWLTYV